MKKTIIYFIIALICVSLTNGGLFEAETPPPIIINENTDLTVDTITANQITIFGGLFASLSYSLYTGSDLSGSDGETNRNISSPNATLIDVENAFLHPETDYNKAGNYIVFLNPIWDTQTITIWGTNLELGIGNFTYLNFDGTDLSGDEGEANRALITNNITMAVIDNSFLHPVSDYVVNLNNVTFLNPVWNSSSITIWRN